MKRLLFVYILLLTPVFAQAQVSLDFEHTPRKDILTAIAKGSHLSIVFDDEVSGDWSGHLTYLSLGEAIRAVLPEGYEAITENFVIHIRRASRPPSAVTPEHPTTPLANRVPRSMAESNAITAQLAEAENTRRRFAPRYDYSASGYSAYSGYGYGPWEAEAWRQFVNRGQEAGIRTSGDVKGAQLFADNCYIGDAAEFTHWWNQQSSVRAGQVVKITVRRIADNKAYDLPVSFPSVAESGVAGMRHFTFSVHSEDLDRGYAFDPKALANCRR